MIEAQSFWSSRGSAASSILEAIWNARRSGSIKVYCYALRKYFLYRRSLSEEVKLPIDSFSACQYLSFLKDSGTSLGGIKSALNAMKWIHNFIPSLNKFNDPLDDKIVQAVFDNALRSVKPVRNMKAPLPKEFIKFVFDSFSLSRSLVVLRDAAIVCLAFSLLLRHDEISHISCNHFSLIENGVKLVIPSSKTDSLRNGKDVFLAFSEGSYSTSGLLMRYMKLANLSLGQNHFLFGPVKLDKSSGVFKVLNSKLSYNSYRLILRKQLVQGGFDPDLYGFHSCRSGGATSLASSTTPLELMSAGRWKDQRSLAHYVEIPVERRLEMSSSVSML